MLLWYVNAIQHVCQWHPILSGQGTDYSNDNGTSKSQGKYINTTSLERSFLFQALFMSWRIWGIESSIKMFFKSDKLVSFN